MLLARSVRKSVRKSAKTRILEDKAGPLPLCLLPPTTRPLRGGTAGFFNRRLQATARLLFFQGANALGVTYAPVGVQYVTRVTFSTPQRLTQLGSRDEAHTQDPSVGFSGFFYSLIECVHCTHSTS